MTGFQQTVAKGRLYLFGKHLGFLVVLSIYLSCALWSMQATTHTKYGDALTVTNVMVSGKHFAEKGFLASKLTPFIPSHEADWSSKGGFYYTHFPPIPNYLGGVIWKLGGRSLLSYKLFNIFMAALFVVGVYAVFYRLMNPPFALCITGMLILQTMLYSLTSTQPSVIADVLYIWSVFMVLLAVERSGSKGLFFAGAWVLNFLNAYSSFEFIVAALVLATGVIWMKMKRNRWQWTIFLASAPVVAIGLHFFNNAWVLGGIGNAYQDLAQAFAWRTVDAGRGTDYLQRIAGGLSGYPFYLLERVQHHYGRLWPAGVLALTIGAFTFKTEKRSQHVTFGKLVGLFAVANASFWFLFPQLTAIQFNSITGRYWLITHALVFGGGLYILLQGVWNHRRKALGYILIIPILALSMVLASNIKTTAYFMTKGYKLTWNRELTLLKAVNRKMSDNSVLLMVDKNLARAAYLHQPRESFGLRPFDVAVLNNVSDFRAKLESYCHDRPCYLLISTNPEEMKKNLSVIEEMIPKTPGRFAPLGEVGSYFLFKVRKPDMENEVWEQY